MASPPINFGLLVPKNDDNNDVEENSTEESEDDEQLGDLISLVKRRKNKQRFT